MLDKFVEYAISEGPWAVVCIVLTWLWLRTRKEAKATVDALVDEKKSLAKDLLAEKDARRVEALELSQKGHETVAELVKLMDKLESTLNRVEAAMVGCLRSQGGKT